MSKIGKYAMEVIAEVCMIFFGGKKNILKSVVMMAVQLVNTLKTI